MIKNIEILRFLFSLTIICVHIKGMILKPLAEQIPFYQMLIDNFRYAHLPVDFFFIIAGFFLFLKTDFLQSFWSFAIKKLIRLMPVVFYIIILYWFVSLFTPIKFLMYDNVFFLLNIGNCGLTFKYGNNDSLWFVSALFWGMSFYFYLYKLIDKQKFNFVTACIIFFCYAMWLHSTGSNFENNYYVFNRGMLRALAGIGIGYFISNIYKENIEYIKAISLNIFQKFVITFAEVFLFCFIFKYTCFHRMNYNNPLILIVAFIGLFVLFLGERGYFSELLDNNISVFLGKFAYSIFITHFLIKDLWGKVFYKECLDWVIVHPYTNIVCLYLTIILFGVFTYYFVEKPAVKFLKEKIKIAKQKTAGN